jgi:hypothetical protein
LAGAPLRNGSLAKSLIWQAVASTPIRIVPENGSLCGATIAGGDGNGKNRSGD